MSNIFTHTFLVLARASRAMKILKSLKIRKNLFSEFWSISAPEVATRATFCRCLEPRKVEVGAFLLCLRGRSAPSCGSGDCSVAKKFQNIFKHFFLKIPKKSKRFFEIPKNSKQFFENSEKNFNSKYFLKIPKNSKHFLKIPKNSKHFFENSKKFQTIFRKFQKKSKKLKEFRKHFLKIQDNFQEF